MSNKFLIAIQPIKGSYSRRWINYCKMHNYKYKLVDVYRNDIITQLEGCTHFLWHFHHAKLKDMLFARQLLYSIENMGIKVFPDFHTAWHFDDKVGQKYLLESIGAPLVKSFVFYDKISALKWANTSTFPFVFKLRGGAGSQNVSLIRSKRDAYKIIDIAFSKGFDNNRPGKIRMRENWRKFKEYKSFNYFKETIAGFKNYIFPTKLQKLNNIVEKGYLYVQEFLPNNDSDIRIIVVGNRALGIKRFVRKNDFRASGSDNYLVGRRNVDERCVEIAFDITKRLNSQSVVYDFIYDLNNDPKIVEISYASEAETYDDIVGYWDSNLNWYSGQVKYEYWSIEDLLQK